MGGGASLKPGCFFSKLSFDGTLRQAQGMLLKTILRLGLDQTEDSTSFSYDIQKKPDRLPGFTEGRSGFYFFKIVFFVFFEPSW